MQQTRARYLERIWRINKDIPADVIDSLPPIFQVVPTKFNNSIWSNCNSGSNCDKFAGANVRINLIAACAYGIPSSRIRFPLGVPPVDYDFIATKPHAQEALQRWLKVHYGIVGHFETDDMAAFAVQVKNPNAPGFKPAIPGKHDQYDNRYGDHYVYHSSNEFMDTGPPRYDGFVYFLEDYLGEPVIDETGITDPFAVHLEWPTGDPQGLEDVLANQLGLELVPTNIPVKILVMEQVK